MDAFSCLTNDVFVKCFGKGIADYCSGFVQLVCLATFLQVSETDTFDLSQVSIELAIFLLAFYWSRCWRRLFVHTSLR